MGREYDPVVGQWYEDLEENEVFHVLSVDPDAELIEIQYENGDVEEMDLDTWRELDLEHTDIPEGWSASAEDEEDEEEEEEEEDDDDWDEDDDDDWDEDEEDESDYSDRDDG